MKKKHSYYINTFSVFGVANSQQVPQFSQNMFNKLVNNPGSAGSSDLINATLLHRSQWMGFEGSHKHLT